MIEFLIIAFMGILLLAYGIFHLDGFLYSSKISAIIAIIGFVMIIVGGVMFIHDPFTDPEIKEQKRIEAKEKSEQRQQEIQRKHDISRESLDCDELKDLRLELLSEGANADVWIGYSKDDKNLRIAQERHEVLCS